jgi:putative hydrolase of the HAD superfamily
MEIALLADHPDYAPKIAKWYFDEWAHMASHVTESMVLEKVIEKSVNREKIPLALVALDDGELLGVLELKLRENKHYPEYENWIGGVFTNPATRGHGVASKLLHKAKELTAAFGIRDLYLQCESFNVALYLKHGFKQLHQAQHHDMETTIMVWRVLK